ncbi:MAG: S-layer homology domain-containing protein, partial [Megasphaera sp.]|nr:S-layer homology domain-containing protein [Megasphaera sp.]
MDLNKKALVVLAAVTLGTAGTALAASADSFSDVPKDHWSYEALDYLAKEGVIEGMGNSTFEGGRTMTRYEVASIVAKAMQKGGGNFGDKTVLEKLHAEYADEINVLQQQVAKNTKQIEQNTKDIQENKEKIDRVKLYGFMRTQYDYDKDTTSGTIDKQT